MIATHAPKMYSPRLKQPALRARVVAPEADAITSATTRLRQELWAAPINGADMAAVRQERDTLADAWPDTFLPPIVDPGIKQVLVPAGDWRADEYVATSPVASMGLTHELYQRLKEQQMPYLRWRVQPIPAALANHGEVLAVQGGSVRLLRRGVAEISGDTRFRSDAPAVVLSGRVERMNVSGGMLSIGWPAITAIGGLVHAIERKTGEDLEFAFALDDIQWIASGLHTVSRGSNPLPPRSQSGGVRSGQVYGVVAPAPGYKRDEIQANGHFSLLLRGARDIDAVARELSAVTRLAGGSVFDASVTVIRPGAVFAAQAFLIDASSELQRRAPGMDALDAALAAYGRDGSWTDGQWFQPRNGYTINATGYAWLEEPQPRKNVRGNYPHAWSESAFSLVTQGGLTSAAWWRRHAGPHGVRWRGAA